MSVEEIVSDAEIEKAFLNTNFGGMQPRVVVSQAVLKCASGFYQGHTSKTICEELNLISSAYEITGKGRAYLWAAFHTEVSV